MSSGIGIEDIWVLIVERSRLKTEICFIHVPSKEDFLRVVKQTPWMVVWENELIPLIKKTKWPMVAAGYKRNEVELVQGKEVVGKITIERRQVYKNNYNERPAKQ